MVILTVKHATEVQFLFNVPVKTEVSKVKEELRKIYNARLKVERLATEIDQLAQFGTMLPENMQGELWQNFHTNIILPIWLIYFKIYIGTGDPTP